VIRDWNGLTRRVSAGAERRWEPLLTSLAGLTPPGELAKRHADMLATLRRRPEREVGPAAAAAFSVNARITVRELVDDAIALPAASPGAVAYARDLRRLWTNNEAASDRDYAQLEVHCDGALRRMRRLKPPAAMADDHARLLDLMERYCAAARQRTAAMASADRVAVQAATVRLESMSTELTRLLRPWHDDERERWYGPQ
jgi:hypothetical protein